MRLARLTALTAIALALLAAPLTAGAQQAGKVPRIGLLDPGSLTGRAPLWEAFRHGMRQLGYVEGRTVTFEARGADGNADRLRSLADELVHLKVDVIVTTTIGSRAAEQATTTIPIVVATGDRRENPSLARPVANVTGVMTLAGQLMPKRLDLARELVPEASRFTILWSVGNAPHSATVRETEAAAVTLGVGLYPVWVRSPADLDGAFSTIAKGHPAVVLFTGGPLLFAERRRLAELAMTHRLPTVSTSREYVEAGALMSYGANLPDSLRRAAVYVDKILKGARPGDLPIEQPTKFELVINLKTAKALSLTIPPSVLARADEVIQ